MLDREWRNFILNMNFDIREISPKLYATIILKRDEGGPFFNSSVRFGAKSRLAISSSCVHVPSETLFK